MKNITKALIFAGSLIFSQSCFVSKYPLVEEREIEGKKVVLEKLSEDKYNWILFDGDVKAYFSKGKIDSVDCLGKRIYEGDLTFDAAKAIDKKYFSYFEK